MIVYLPNVDALMAPLITDTVMAQLVNDTYTPDVHHSYLTDVPSGARLGAPFELTVKSVSDGAFFSNAIATAIAVAGGDVVTGIVFYRATGTEATSRLVAFQDRRADTVPLSIATDGNDIAFEWPYGGQVLKL